MKPRGGIYWPYLVSVGVSIIAAISFYNVALAMSSANPSTKSVVNYSIHRTYKKLIKTGIPTHITIKSLNIDLDVGIGSYDPKSNTWTIDATKAYYADTSVPLNNHNGTTLIYGHAQASVFAELLKIRSGAEAIVYSDNGYRFYYTYKSTHQVTPSDTSVFNEDGEPVLVLQTCSGAWDAYRSLFVFKLQRVD
jgi:LPXTG-site transpeptidase (sortase) family protein